MKNNIAVLLSLILLWTFNVTAQIAIKGETVYTLEGDAITNGVVLIKEGKIEKVGPADKVKIPDNYKTYSGKVVTPGLVDAHSTVGFTGIYNNARHDQEQLDKTAPIQPELRAIDAYNPREELVQFTREWGITTVHTGHAPGALISGQTMIAKTLEGTVKDVTRDEVTMLAFTLDNSVKGNFKSPGTQAKGVAMLRADLIQAQEYMQKQAGKDETKRPARNLKMEALAALLRGETKALITANKASTIMTAIRLAKEFNFKLVLDGAAESYLLINEIKASGAELILHPGMARKYGDMKNASYETAATLAKAGIPFALQSGYEGYVPKVRIVLYEAAIAARFGLPFEDALKSITINAAKIIGMQEKVGSLAVGKDADVVIYNGDPFEYTTKACLVVIEGAVVFLGCE